MTTTFVVPPLEELAAAEVGYRRQVNAVQRQLKPRHDAWPSLWGGGIEGAIAEYVASIVTGLPWTGRDFLFDHDHRVAPPDLGERTEVKWSMSPDRPTMTYDPDRDRVDCVYVLVSGRAPTMVVHGSLAGRSCCRPEWRVVYPERVVYRVPASAFHPIGGDR